MTIFSLKIRGRRKQYRHSYFDTLGLVASFRGDNQCVFQNIRSIFIEIMNEHYFIGYSNYTKMKKFYLQYVQLVEVCQHLAEISLHIFDTIDTIIYKREENFVKQEFDMYVVPSSHCRQNIGAFPSHRKNDAQSQDLTRKN